MIYRVANTCIHYNYLCSWRQLAAANTVKYRGDDTGKPTSLFGILTTFGPAALQSELQVRA